MGNLVANVGRPNVEMCIRDRSYAIRERTGGDFHLRTVYKESLIEVVDLLLQFNGVVVSVAFRSKYRLMLRLVSAQHLSLIHI